MFKHGTCALLSAGTSDNSARDSALQTLMAIVDHHPDMNPLALRDGNVLVRYNQPAVNIVFPDVAKEHWDEIEGHHLDGLTPDEVLITNLGPNTFDDVGKKALLGRAFMFMDAQDPDILTIVRSAL